MRRSPAQSRDALQPFRLQPFVRHPRGSRSDLVLGFQCVALVFQRTMIDPHLDPSSARRSLTWVPHASRQCSNNAMRIPIPHLGVEAVFVDGAHGEHDIGVGLRLPIGPNAG